MIRAKFTVQSIARTTYGHTIKLSPVTSGSETVAPLPDLKLDKRYAIVYNVRDSERAKVPGVRQNVRGRTEDGSVLLRDLSPAGISPAEGADVNLDRQRFELMVKLRTIASEIQDDHLNHRLVETIDKVDDLIKHILFAEVEA